MSDRPFQPPVMSPRECTLWYVALGLAVIGKAWCLITYHTPLLGEFWRMEQFADQMLTDSRWLQDAGLDSIAIPPTLWKPVGYPALMAAAKLMAGPFWTQAIFVLQAVASLLAGCALFGLARRLGLPVVWAVAVFLLYEGALPFSTDTLLMSDGLMGSLGTFVLVLFGHRALDRSGPSPTWAVACGLILAVMFTLREVVEYMVVVYGLAVLLIFARPGQRLRAAVAALLLMVPVALTDLAVRAWNHQRTGAFMVTSGLQTAGLFTVLQLNVRDPVVMSGDDVFDRLAREGLTDHQYGDAQRLNQLAFERFGLTAPQLSALVSRKMVAGVLAAPRAAIAFWLSEIRLVQQGSLLGGPLTRIDDLDWWWAMTQGAGVYDAGWRGKVRAFLVSHDPSGMDAGAWVNLLLRIVSRYGGTALFLLFTFGIPVYAWRRRSDGAARFLLAGWLLYWAMAGLHIMVHMEVRYLSAVGAVPVLASLLLARELLTMWKSRRDVEPGVGME